MPFKKFLQMLRNRNAALVALCLFALFLYWKSGYEQEQKRYRDIKLHLLPEGGRAFVQEDQLLETLTEHELLPANRRISDVELDVLEARVSQNPFCLDVEAYWDIEGNLHLDFQQRQPLARVIDRRNRSYYIDEQLKIMPLSGLFTARVPLITGAIDEKPTFNDTLKSDAGRKVTAIARALRKMSFLRLVSNQIRLEKKGALVLISSFKHHRFILGDTSNLEKKLLKLKVFYREILPRKGWDAYDTVYLNYQNQIVANNR